jgi:hypothetical protein
MKQVTKILSFIFIGCGAIYIIYWAVIILVAGTFTSDSNRFSEDYVFSGDYVFLINKITVFKSEHPEYKIEDRAGTYERRKYYHEHFYSPDEGYVFRCVIRLFDSNDENTILSLVSVSCDSNLSEWKNINTDDLSCADNKEVKRIFETEILNNLGTPWRKKRWYSF